MFKIKVWFFNIILCVYIIQLANQLFICFKQQAGAGVGILAPALFSEVKGTN